jgi:Flp pilus assembly protein protease CpaA
MWWQSSLLGLLLLAGWQDLRTRTVSNWITIPLFAAGLVGLIVRRDGLAILTALLLTLASYRGWMAGGDWKVLIGLFGLWPVAGYAALLTAAAWGAVEMLRTRSRYARFPGVSAFALGALLTFTVQVWYLIASN